MRRLFRMSLSRRLFAISRAQQQPDIERFDLREKSGGDEGEGQNRTRQGDDQDQRFDSGTGDRSDQILQGFAAVYIQGDRNGGFDVEIGAGGIQYRKAGKEIHARFTRDMQYLGATDQAGT